MWRVKLFNNPKNAKYTIEIIEVKVRNLNTTFHTLHVGTYCHNNDGNNARTHNTHLEKEESAFRWRSEMEGVRRFISTLSTFRLLGNLRNFFSYLIENWTRALSNSSSRCVNNCVGLTVVQPQTYSQCLKMVKVFVNFNSKRRFYKIGFSNVLEAGSHRTWFDLSSQEEWLFAEVWVLLTQSLPSH